MAKKTRPRDDDEDDDDDDKPRAKRRANDDDDDDDAPKKKRRIADDDDEDDDRPKKKKGKYSGVIPYKNGAALAAYYCGVFGFIPFAHFLLAPIAAALGVLGIAKARQMPESKGIGHAIAGIILGVVSLVLWPVLYITVFKDMMAAANK